jgi:hypothetical protein
MFVNSIGALTAVALYLVLASTRLPVAWSKAYSRIEVNKFLFDLVGSTYSNTTAAPSRQKRKYIENCKNLLCEQ